MQKCIQLNLKDGFGYYYIINNRSKLILDLEINFHTSTGVKLKKPFNIENCKFNVLPKSEMIVPMMISPYGYSYKCSEAYSTI